MNPQYALQELAQRGLYRPETEHDSCGVGMVANIKGVKSHQIIDESLEVLVNLGHRGACGCDPETGDGAGILIQMPHEFFRKVCPPLGIHLPADGSYGAGTVFLPPQTEARQKCEALIEQTVADEGLEFLGWRDVPVDPARLGRDSRSVMPAIKQMFVGASSGPVQSMVPPMVPPIRWSRIVPPMVPPMVPFNPFNPAPWPTPWGWNASSTWSARQSSTGCLNSAFPVKTPTSFTFAACPAIPLCSRAC